MNPKTMTIQHLKNRIAWLERNKPDHWGIHGDELPSGSMTVGLIEDEIERIDKEIKDLETELVSRGVL